MSRQERDMARPMKRSKPPRQESMAISPSQKMDRRTFLIAIGAVAAAAVLRGIKRVEERRKKLEESLVPSSIKENTACYYPPNEEGEINPVTYGDGEPFTLEKETPVLLYPEKNTGTWDHGEYVSAIIFVEEAKDVGSLGKVISYEEVLRIKKGNNGQIPSEIKAYPFYLPKENITNPRFTDIIGNK